MKAYLAGPLFSDQDRAKLEELAKMVEALGIKVFLPHRDAGDLGSVQHRYGTKFVRDQIFDRDVLEVESCDFLIALLDGADIDSGTAMEIGIAYAQGIKVFGLKSDFYRRNGTINNMVWGACDRGKTMVYTSKMLLRQLEAFVKKTNHARRRNRTAGNKKR